MSAVLRGGGGGGGSTTTTVVGLARPAARVCPAGQRRSLGRVQQRRPQLAAPRRPLRSEAAAMGDSAAGPTAQDGALWALAEGCLGGLWGVVEVPPPPHSRYDSLLSYRAIIDGSKSLKTDGLTLQGVEVSLDDVYLTLMPLVEWIRQLRRQAKGSNRVLIGISGPGGSGKTTLATVLAAALNIDRDSSCCVLGQDAYHHRTHHLQSTEAVNPYTGEQAILSSIKGTPPSFDVESFVADLRRCLSATPSETVRLPQYDRTLHEPVDSRVAIGPATEVVLVEGLFLLDDSEGWGDIAPLLAGSISLAVPKQECEERLRRRQTAAGRSPETIASNFERVDGPNHDRISAREERADLVLQQANGSSRADGRLQLQIVSNKRVPQREARLLVIGLNPALQKAMWFPKLQTGAVNRAHRTALSVGGKGQGCARAAGSCAPGTTAVAHFLGGSNGKFISDSLAECGLAQLSEWVAGETRVCTTLLCQDTNTATEIIDPSAEISPAEVEALREQILESLQGCMGLTICGTFPPGVDESFYASVVRACPDYTTVVLDGYKGVGQTLATGRVDVLKINKDEVLELSGCESLPQGAAKCLRELLAGGASLAVTDGPHPAELFSRGARHTFRMPVHLEVVNPIGAGDTCTGVMSYCIMWGLPVAEAFHWGLAAACASCLQEGGAVFSVKDMYALHKQIEVTVSAWDEACN